MIKLFAIATLVAVVSFFVAQQSAFGQSVSPTGQATMTPSPSRTMTVPTSAPATGFGPY